MKIVALVKPTPDTETKIGLGADSKSLDLSSAKYVINPYDEFAIEEALQIKEEGTASEVVIVSVCEQARKEVIVKALAMGADRGVIVDSQQDDSLSIAKILHKVIAKEQPQLILGGRHAIDDDNMHVLAMLGGLTDYPCINVVTKVEASANKLTVHREVESGQVEVYEVVTPCILGAHKALNNPRYTSLPGIMKARKKPLEIHSLADLSVDESSLSELQSKIEVLEYIPPVEKSAGKVFKDQPIEEMAKSLVKALREEAKVI